MSRHPAGAAWRRLALLAATLAWAAPAALRAQEPWQLQGLDGGALTSSEVARGTTVMVVWAAWSPRCRDVVERSNALVDRWSGRARVVLVDFQEDPAEVSGFLAGKGPRAGVYLDREGSFARQHRVTTLPGLVVYRDGAVVYRGKLPDDPDRVLADLLR